MARVALDRLLDPKYLGDLPARPIEEIRSMLAEHVTSPGPGRLPTYFEPGDLEEVSAQLDAIVDTAALSGLPELSDDGVRELMERLTGLEHEVSAQRRAL